jgi:estrone sulfotransferase
MSNKVKALSSRVRLSVLYLIGFAGIRRDDVLLVSFPRSGNTWMRLLLCNLISLREWEGKKVDFSLLNKTMPELGVNNLLAPWPYATIPRVVKTHRSYSAPFRANRSIGIIRDPRDVMVSFYHYSKDRKGLYRGDFSNFIRNPRFGLESWFRHYLSWRDHFTLTMTYEQMKEDTLREFHRVLDVLNVSYSEDMIREAVQRSNLASIREAEKSASLPENGQAIFARSGVSRQWPSYFSEQDLAYYQELSDQYGVFLYPRVAMEPNQ